MVEARTAFTVKENGLIQPWRGHGLVFMNPPHSTSPYNIEPWMEKAHQEFVETELDRNTLDAFVGLVPAKTDTAWFHSHATPMAIRCFLRGRLKFWQHGQEMPGPGKFASMIVYHGPATGLFFRIFSPYGWVV